MSLAVLGTDVFERAIRETGFSLKFTQRSADGRGITAVLELSDKTLQSALSAADLARKVIPDSVTSVARNLVRNKMVGRYRWRVCR